MSELKINGKVKEVLLPESGVSKKGKEWTKQNFIIETQGKYPTIVYFTVFGENMALIKGLNQGDDVDVSFNIESREYNGKYFHNVNAYRVEKLGGSTPRVPAPTPPVEDEGSDGLPF